MAYFIRPLDPTNATFTENDIFGRKDFGARLMKIVKDHHDYELVIGLDAQWGDGKTVFIHQWKNLLIDNGFKVAYYDAFSHDYHSEPLIPFVTEIYKLFDKYQDNDKVLFKTFAIELLNLATLQILPNTIDALVEQRFNSISEFESSIAKFRELIKKLRSKTDNTELPIVFIIDELDRCKPSYTIKLLEVIKHLFSVPGINFVLSVNSVQLRESIKHQYGREIDAGLYLNKFIHLWATLPKAKHNNNQNMGDDNKIYVDFCAKKLEIDRNFASIFSTQSTVFELSFREIEKCLTYILLFQDKISDANDFVVIGCLYAIILKVKFPDHFYLITKKEISYEKLISDELQRKLTAKSNVILNDIDNIARILEATNASKAVNKARSDGIGNNDIDKIRNNYNDINRMFILLSNFDF